MKGKKSLEFYGKNGRMPPSSWQKKSLVPGRKRNNELWISLLWNLMCHSQDSFRGF